MHGGVEQVSSGAGTQRLVLAPSDAVTSLIKSAEWPRVGGFGKRA